MDNNSDPDINALYISESGIIEPDKSSGSNESDTDVLYYPDDYADLDEEDIITNSTIDSITQMLNSISKRLNAVIENPTECIHDLHNEYNDIISNFDTIINKNYMLMSLSDRVKSDINICKNLFQLKLIEDNPISTEENRILQLKQLEKLEMNQYLARKGIKASKMVHDIWSDDPISGNVGLKLQKILNKIKYIIRIEQKQNNLEEIGSDLVPSARINRVYDIYLSTKFTHKDLIDDDLCLTILANEIEICVNDYFKD